MHGTRPIKHLRQKRKHSLDLIFRLELAVAAFVGVVRLIPQIPTEHALILREGADDSGDISTQAR